MLDFIQWPAMALSVLAAWMTASQRSRLRATGFWIFALSNLVWAVWGWAHHAYALITLQAILFTLNVRGLKKNETL